MTTARYLTPSGRSIQRDYSKIDLYDYFNHKNGVEAIDKPYFEARTITDRKVFGGDGIQPDEAFKVDEINQIEASLLDPIFVFASEVVNGRVPGHENYRAGALTFGKRVTPGVLPVTEALLVAFTDFTLKNPSSKYSRSALKSESAFIKLRLRYNLIMASFGAVSANQVLTEDDAQVAKAVETLPRAAQLAQLAAKARLQANR